MLCERPPAHPALSRASPPHGRSTWSLSPLGALFVLLVALVAIPSTLHGIGYASHGLDSRLAAGVLPDLHHGHVARARRRERRHVHVPVGADGADLARARARGPRSSRGGEERRDLVRGAHARRRVGDPRRPSHRRSARPRSDLRRTPPSGGTPSPWVRSLVFVLALIGFGSKAGVVPLHVWLPKAHPEAPSPVSALMSGAMVALGVYGIILVGDVILGGGPLWWWLVVLAVGAASALFGSLHAASSTDLKRLLGLLDHRQRRPRPPRPWRLGALRRDAITPQLGGARDGRDARAPLQPRGVQRRRSSSRRVPSRSRRGRATSTSSAGCCGACRRQGRLFLVAAAAICALPPLNGFVGEWLLFQSLLARREPREHR